MSNIEFCGQMKQNVKFFLNFMGVKSSKADEHNIGAQGMGYFHHWKGIIEAEQDFKKSVWETCSATQMMSYHGRTRLFKKIYAESHSVYITTAWL